MGQAASKAARQLPRSTTSGLRKTAAEVAAAAKSEPAAHQQTNNMKTRQEMLNEDADADTGESAKVADNLKYFLNPKELLTPITPKDPNENINVQALRSRRVDDDFEVVERVRADEVAQMLRGKGGEGAAKKLDERTVRVLREYLEPVRQ